MRASRLHNCGRARKPGAARPLACPGSAAGAKAEPLERHCSPFAFSSSFLELSFLHSGAPQLAGPSSLGHGDVSTIEIGQISGPKGRPAQWAWLKLDGASERPSGGVLASNWRPGRPSCGLAEAPRKFARTKLFLSLARAGRALPKLSCEGPNSICGPQLGRRPTRGLAERSEKSGRRSKRESGKKRASGGGSCQAEFWANSLVFKPKASQTRPGASVASPQTRLRRTFGRRDGGAQVVKLFCLPGWKLAPGSGD